VGNFRAGFLRQSDGGVDGGAFVALVWWGDGASVCCFGAVSDLGIAHRELRPAFLRSTARSNCLVIIGDGECEGGPFGPACWGRKVGDGDAATWGGDLWILRSRTKLAVIATCNCWRSGFIATRVGCVSFCDSMETRENSSGDCARSDAGRMTEQHCRRCERLPIISGCQKLSVVGLRAAGDVGPWAVADRMIWNRRCCGTRS